MRAFILFPVFLLVGCTSSMTDKTESLKKEQTLDFKMASIDKGSNSYSGDPVDHIVVNASGNGQIHLTVGDKGKVTKGEKRDTSDKEEIEETFSVDYYLRSIPLAGWALIMVLLIVILGVIWWFIKTTAIGKAMDASLGKGIEMTEKGIERVYHKLADADKGTDLHTQLQHELSRLERERADYLAQKKHKKS